MTVNDGSRPWARLRLLALLAALPLIGATLGGVLRATPASAATRAQVVHLMDVNGASVVDRSDHGGSHDHSGHDGHHDGNGDHDHHGAECNNCGVGNGDHRWDGHGGDDDKDHHHDGGDDHDGHGGLARFLVEGAKALAHLLGG